MFSWITENRAPLVGFILLCLYLGAGLYFTSWVVKAQRAHTESVYAYKQYEIDTYKTCKSVGVDNRHEIFQCPGGGFRSIPLSKHH